MRMIALDLLVTTALAGGLAAATVTTPPPGEPRAKDRGQGEVGTQRRGGGGPAAATAQMRVRLTLPPACAIVLGAEGPPLVRCTSDIPFRVGIAPTVRSPDGRERRLTVEY